MSDPDCSCPRCVQWARNRAIDHEYGLIYESQRDGQDSHAASILVSQIEDIEMLRELVVCFALSQRCLLEEMEG